MAGKLDGVKNFGQNVKDVVTTNDNSIGAGLKFGKDLLNVPVRAAKTIFGLGSDSAGPIARGVRNVGKTTDNIVTGTLNNKYTRTALMVVAAVAIYKGVKGFFSRREKAQVNEVKEGELRKIQMENAAMKAELYGGFDNQRSKPGTFVGDLKQQGHGVQQGYGGRQ